MFFWLVASHVVFHGLLAIWPGDAGWGPRYLVPIVPFIILPAGAVLTWTRGAARPVAWLAFGVLFELGAIFNLGGVLVDQRVSFVELLDEAGGDFAVMDEHHWEPQLSPVLIHWQEIANRYSNLVRSWSQQVSFVSGTYGREAAEPVDAAVAPRPELVETLAERIAKPRLTLLLAVVLLVSMLPWVMYNQARPRLGPRSILAMSRDDRSFTNRPSIRTGYLGAVAILHERGCAQLGFISSVDC